MPNNLTNTQVLVIGGSSGIGLATAVSAAQAGASVTIASRDDALRHRFDRARRRRRSDRVSMAS